MGRGDSCYGGCTFCDRTFSVPLNAMKRVSEAQENLRVQFAEHTCKVSGEPEPYRATLS